MKLFVRIFSSVILLITLCTFCLWRNDAVPDLSGLNAYIERAAESAGNLRQFIEKAAGNDWQNTQKPTDSKAKDEYGGCDLSKEPDPELEAQICEALTAQKTEIVFRNISQEEMKTAYSSVRLSHPEFFYLDSTYECRTTGSTVTLFPRYKYTADEIKAMRLVYEEKLSEVVSGVPAGADDFEKVLYLHDYFVKNYEYDESLTIRDAYTFFTQKTGVCQAYMLAFIAAAERLGVESVPVTSDAMNHAWNLVRVDGSWYHLDITWDDTGLMPSLTSYAYFLQSNAGLAAYDADKTEGNRHYGWVTAKDASDIRYDKAIFREAQTPMVKSGGTYYCTAADMEKNNHRRGWIYAGNDPSAMTPLFDITGGYWSAGMTGYWPLCYSGVLVVDRMIYYNSGNTIYKRDLDTNKIVAQEIPSSLSPGESVYGIAEIQHGEIVFLIASGPMEIRYRTFTLSTAS